MRPFRLADDMDVLNAAEIDAALEAALTAPLNDLLSIAEFAEKTETSAVVAEADASDAIDGDSASETERPDDDSMPSILEFERRALPRAA